MFSLYRIYHLLVKENNISQETSIRSNGNARERYLASLLGKQQDDVDQKQLLKQEQRLKEYLLTYGGTTRNIQFLFPDIPKDEVRTTEHRNTLRAQAEKNFADLNQKYQFYAESFFEDYVAYVQVLHCVAHVIEQNYVENETYAHAYQLMMTFYEQPTQKNQHTNIFAKLEQHLKKYCQDTHKPIHDLAVSYTLPLAHQSNGKRIDIKLWQNIIDKKGERALKLFSHAHEIDKNPQSYEEALSAVTALTYPRAAENKAFAFLCQHYQIPCEEFNKSLDMLSNGKITLKEQDTLPITEVRSDEIPELREKYPNYHLLRLPKNDLRGLILGRLTNCCQHIDGVGESQAIDGMHLENNGFYVLIQGKLGTLEDIDSCKFLGQAYGWRSRHGNFVFDSWEITHINDENKYITQMMVQALAKKIIAEHPEISRITIGQGGKTKEVFADIETRSCAPEFMYQGVPHEDASEQAELAISPALAQIRTQLKERTKIALTDEFLKTVISISFGEALFELPDDILNFAGANLTPSWQTRDVRKQFTAHCIASLGINDNKNIDPLFRNLQKIFEEHPEKYNILISSSCFDICRNGASFLELMMVNDLDHLKFIIENCTNVFFSGIKTSDLTRCATIQEIKQKTLECYTKFYDDATLNAREITDDALLDLLISSFALSIYEKGARVIDCLEIARSDQQLFQNMLEKSYIFDYIFKEGAQSKDLLLLSKTHVEILGKVVNQEFIKKVGWNTFLSVKNEEFLVTLTSYEATTAYHYGAKFSDLALVHNMELLKLLLSPAALNAYQYKADSIDLAKSTSVLEIRQKLLRFFSTHYNQASDVHPIDNILLDSNHLASLLSNEALQLYKQNPMNFRYLTSLPKEHLDYLLANITNRSYHPLFPLNELSGITDLSLFTKLISQYQNVLHFLRCGIKFSEIVSTLDSDLWDILLSQEAREMLGSQKITFSDITAISDLNWLRELITYSMHCQYRELSIPFKELASAHSLAHLQVLTSYEAVQAYKTGAKFSDLNTVEDLQLLQFLVSSPAVMAYQKGGGSAELVQHTSLLAIKKAVLTLFATHYQDPDSSFIIFLTEKKLDLLISHKAYALYEAGIKPSQLAAVKNVANLEHLLKEGYHFRGQYLTELLAIEDLAQLQLLTSHEMRKLYEIGAKVSELTVLDLERLKFFCSEEVQQLCYAAWKATFEDIKLLQGTEHAKSILKNINLREIGATLSDCINLSPERLTFLSKMTDNLWRHKPTFTDLLSISGAAHVTLLTSPEAEQCYRVGVSFAELAAESNLERLRFLISSKAYEAYQRGRTVKDLKKVQTVKHLQCLGQYDMEAIYKDYVPFSDLAAVTNLECLKILIAFYRSRPTIHSKDLVNVTDLKCLTLLTSSELQLDYKYRGLSVPFEELISVTNSVHLERLISPQARQAYKAGVEFNILKQVTDATRFEYLVSEEALACYKCNAQAQDFMMANSKFFPLLLSRNALAAYKAGVSSKLLTQIQDFNCLQLLLSWNAIALYRHGLDPEILSVCSSPLAIKKEMFTYIVQNYTQKKTMEIKFIATLEHTMLDILISQNAREAFEKGLNCEMVINLTLDPEEVKKAIEKFLKDKQNSLPEVTIRKALPPPASGKEKLPSLN